MLTVCSPGANYRQTESDISERNKDIQLWNLTHISVLYFIFQYVMIDQLYYVLWYSEGCPKYVV